MVIDKIVDVMRKLLQYQKVTPEGTQHNNQLNLVLIDPIDKWEMIRYEIGQFFLLLRGLFDYPIGRYLAPTRTCKKSYLPNHRVILFNNRHGNKIDHDLNRKGL